MEEIEEISIYDYFSYNEELSKKKLETLIKELEKINKKEDWSDEDVENKRELEEEIGSRLGLVPVSIFEEWQSDFLKKLNGQLENIMAKLRNHRHEFSRTWSGKAEY